MGFFIKATNDVSTVDAHGAVAHWDGTSWTLVSTGPQSKCCVSVLWTSSTDLWGSAQVSDVDYTMDHFDGTGWTKSVVGTRKGGFSLAGTGPHDLWASGGGAELLHRR